MSPRENLRPELTTLSDPYQSEVEQAYNQLIEELPIINGERILTLHRGTSEAMSGILTRNTLGHLYVVLGPNEEEEEEQMTGWGTNPNLTFLYSRLIDLPLPDASLDRVVLVYSADIFMQKEDLIKEICRVLRPGGVFDILYFDLKEKINGYYFEVKKEEYLFTGHEAKELSA